MKGCNITPEEGLAEMAVGMIDLAKDDYVRGALLLIKRFSMPMDVLVENPQAKSLIEKARPGAYSATERKIYWYKDSLRFIKEDPYGLFPDSEEVIKAWNNEAWRIYRNKFS